MKFQLLALAAMLAWAHQASALDTSASVKVTPLLKTSTSWDGTLKVCICSTFPLGQAAEAHQVLELRKTTGKLLLIP